MSTELQIHQDKPSAVSVIQNALSSGVSPEHLRELLAVRREWEADEARKAFNLSVSEFQRRAPIVEKLDMAHNKQYARMDRIWRDIRPLLTELGLSVTWQIAELRDGVCRVEGQLRHRDGHGERLSMDIPLPDKVSGQNAAQQAGSASTYARRYALCGALGIVTGDDVDDDGHAAGTTYITQDQVDEIDQLVQACRGLNDFNEPNFWAYVGAKSAKEIQSALFTKAQASLKKKIKESSK